MTQVLTCPGPTKSFPGFCPQGIALLRTLKRTKRTNWQPSDQALYELKITNPLLELVCSVSREFARFAPNYVAVPERAVFHIFDKSGSHRAPRPNRPPAAIWVHNYVARGTQGACFYFHFTDKEAVALGGVYAPQRHELSVYRKLLLQNYREFSEILSESRLRLIGGSFQGEKLKVLPQGFRSGDPAAELLRRKQWYLISMLDMPLLSTEQLLSALVTRFEAMAPLVEFFNRPFVGKMKPKRRSFAAAGNR